MQTHSNSQMKNRIGFHYFPDTAHYTNKDLNQWLPFLTKMQAGWLVIKSETSRAIPEQFIAGLISNGITPIIHFPLSLPDSPAPADLRAILNAYASWGAKFIILFDRPNDRTAWSASGWSQANLVESFLDRFIPLANECLNAGLNPVFPPPEPGGSYWDLSFLRTSLQAMQRRNQKNLLNNLTLAAYSWTYEHALDWGKGGQERWSGNKPYLTPADSQDQRGFRNFEWVQAVCQTVLAKSLPMILLGMGVKSLSSEDAYSPEDHAGLVRQILTLLGSSAEQESEAQNILAGNFWLLTTAKDDIASPFAWIKEDGSTLPAVNVLSPQTTQTNKTASFQSPKSNEPKQTSLNNHPIEHYLLLPTYEWGVADWHLEVIKPFVRKHHPTIGFSIDEAALANIVTIVGGEQSFSEDALANLRSRGCQVERISGDGTSIATQLAER